MRKEGNTVFVDEGSECYQIICGAMSDFRVRDFIKENDGMAPLELIKVLNITSKKIGEEINSIKIQKSSNTTMVVTINLRSQTYVPWFTINKEHIAPVIEQKEDSKIINLMELLLITTVSVLSIYGMLFLLELVR